MNDIGILIIEAMAVYVLVLWAHSLRRRFGLVLFFILLGVMWLDVLLFATGAFAGTPA